MSPTRSELRPEPAAPAPARRPRSRLRLALLLAAVVLLAAAGLWGRLPDPLSFVAALTGADYGWVVLAAVLQAVSLAAFAWQQRQLLKSLGVRLRAGHVFAVTLARTALSISLPAGAAVSTAYAIREYQRAGAGREVVAASMIVSGLASIGGLTLLYVTGGTAMVTRDPALLISPRPLAVVAALAALTALTVVAGRRRMRRPAPDAAGKPARPDGRIAGFVRKTLESARDGWRAGAALRGRDWVTAVLYAAANWLTDLLCLVATCRALRPSAIPPMSG